MRTDDGTPFPADSTILSASDFGHYVTPFADLQLVTLSSTATDKDNEFGIRVADDLVLSKPYISNIKDNSPAARLCSSHKASRNKYRGAYIVEIDGIRMLTANQATVALKSAHESGVYPREVQLLLAPEKKLSANATRRAINEQSLFAPSTIWTDQEDIEDPPFLERLPIPTNGIFPNGTVIRRLFKKDGDSHRTWFEGIITTYDTTRELYMVLYTDGDSEEMNHSDIVKNRKQAYQHLDSLHALIQRKLAPAADDMDSSVPTIDIYSL